MLLPDEGSLGEVLELEDWPIGLACANLPMVKCSGLEVDIIDYAQTELLIRRMLSVSGVCCEVRWDDNSSTGESE